MSIQRPQTARTWFRLAGPRLFPLLLAGLACGPGAFAAEGEADTIILEDTPGDALGGEGEILIMDEGEDAQSADSIEIGPEDGIEIEDSGTGIVIEPDTQDAPLAADAPDAEAGLEEEDADEARLKLDQVWFEYGAITASNSVDGQAYGQASASFEWKPAGPWELQLEARLDGYLQHGEPDFDRVEVDYGENFLRWRGEKMRITAGTQTVLWGRIDELPPMDRVSRVDLSRGIVDDLPDRRRALPALRIEGFLPDEAKLDAVWIPAFRPAQLPPTESIWYPVDQSRGIILGLDLDPITRAVIRGARIDDDGPGDDGGFGLRYTKTGASLDYGVTLQNNRQSLPYFRYDPVNNTLVAEHPRSWIFGGDLAFQAEGATWRAEVIYADTIPVTREDGRYDTVEAISWGAGVEFFPGDGDTRLNLQIVANHLLNAPPVQDRTDVYNFNGSIETPFANNRWRAEARFFIGLDERDIYINPEIAFLGWEPHELYLDFHYFDGADGTLGGYYENNDMVALGWRSRF